MTSASLPRILSLRQPWLFAILYLGKRIENRSRPILGSYRGDLLLHASARKSTRDEERYHRAAREWVREHVGKQTSGQIPHDIDSFFYGGVLARCTARAVIPPNGDVIAKHAVIDYAVDTCWWMQPQWGYVLSDVCDLGHVPWRGRMGVQIATPDLMDRIGGNFRSQEDVARSMFGGAP